MFNIARDVGTDPLLATVADVEDFFRSRIGKTTLLTIIHY